VVSNSKVVYGITIPSEAVTIFGEKTNFEISISGNMILLTSGASNIPTKKEVEEFDWQTIRV